MQCMVETILQIVTQLLLLMLVLMMLLLHVDDGTLGLGHGSICSVGWCKKVKRCSSEGRSHKQRKKMNVAITNENMLTNINRAHDTIR